MDAWNDALFLDAYMEEFYRNQPNSTPKDQPFEEAQSKMNRLLEMENINFIEFFGDESGCRVSMHYFEREAHDALLCFDVSGEEGVEGLSQILIAHFEVFPSGLDSPEVWFHHRIM